MKAFNHKAEASVSCGCRESGKKPIIGLLIGFLAAFLLLQAANPCQADEVVMKNGDRIQGTVVSLSQGKLVFNTSYAG